MKTVQFTQSGLDYMAYVNGEYNHKDSLSGRYVRAEVAERLKTTLEIIRTYLMTGAWFLSMSPDECIKQAIKQAEEG